MLITPYFLSLSKYEEVPSNRNSCLRSSFSDVENSEDYSGYESSSSFSSQQKEREEEDENTESKKELTFISNLKKEFKLIDGEQNMRRPSSRDLESIQRSTSLKELNAISEEKDKNNIKPKIFQKYVKKECSFHFHKSHPLILNILEARYNDKKQK